MRTMKTLSILVAAAFSVGGCATGRDYQLYAQGQAQIESAKYAAEAARYKAMSDIANSGDTAAKVAAVVALAVERGGGSQQNSSQLRAPESLSQTLLPWAGLLVPALTQGFAVYQNVRLGMAQSNNSARIAESTNATFYGMGQQIGAAAGAGTQATANTAAAGFSALTTMSGQVQAAGQAGAQATANTAAAGFTALTGLANTSNTNLTTVSGMIAQPQPNISYTLTGGGVVGNGTFTSSTQANPTTTTLSGTGVVGAGTLTTQANPTTTTTTTNANPTTTTTTTGSPTTTTTGSPTTTTTTNNANTNTNGTGVQGPITN